MANLCRRATNFLAGAAALAAVAAAGCGSEDPGTGGLGGEGRLLPLVVGATWTYRITDPFTGTISDKSSTVEQLEPVGDRKPGVMALRVRTEKIDGLTISWQEDTGTSIVRHREQSINRAGAVTSEEWYAPPKLRIDDTTPRTTPGATWTEVHTETEIKANGIMSTKEKSDVWTIERVEEVTVPAGTFQTLRVRRADSDGTGGAKTYWFARGIGKVKETGGQTEELVSHAIP